MLRKIIYSVCTMADYESPHSFVVRMESFGVLCGSTGAEIDAPSFSVDDEWDIEF